MVEKSIAVLCNCIAMVGFFDLFKFSNRPRFTSIWDWSLIRVTWSNVWAILASQSCSCSVFFWQSFRVSSCSTWRWRRTCHTTFNVNVSKAKKYQQHCKGFIFQSHSRSNYYPFCVRRRKEQKNKERERENNFRTCSNHRQASVTTLFKICFDSLLSYSFSRLLLAIDQRNFWEECRTTIDTNRKRKKEKRKGSFNGGENKKKRDDGASLKSWHTDEGSIEWAPAFLAGDQLSKSTHTHILYKQTRWIISLGTTCSDCIKLYHITTAGKRGTATLLDN